MSTGFFLNKLQSTVAASDLDVFFGFTPSRGQPVSQMSPLYVNGPTASDILQIPGTPGCYSLRLPSNVFNALGFYYVLITGKSYLVQINSCAVVISTTSANSNQSISISKTGIVIPAININSTSSGSGALVGYTVRYMDNSGNIIPNLFRIITSSDLVSPANSSNLNSGSGSVSASYVLDSQGSFLFLTLAADELSLVVPGQQNLGAAGQQIILSSPSCDPTALEIELVDQSIETLSIAVLGNSTRDEGTGVLSYYDFTGNIYSQYLLYQTKNKFTNAIIDVKQQLANINLNQTFVSITQGT